MNNSNNKDNNVSNSQDQDNKKNQKDQTRSSHISPNISSGEQTDFTSRVNSKNSPAADLNRNSADISDFVLNKQDSTKSKQKEDKIKLDN